MIKLTFLSKSSVFFPEILITIASEERKKKNSDKCGYNILESYNILAQVGNATSEMKFDIYYNKLVTQNVVSWVVERLKT